jgi:hypothetical protein
MPSDTQPPHNCPTRLCLHAELPSPWIRSIDIWDQSVKREAGGLLGSDTHLDRDSNSSSTTSSLIPAAFEMHELGSSSSATGGEGVGAHSDEQARATDTSDSGAGSEAGIAGALVPAAAGAVVAASRAQRPSMHRMTAWWRSTKRGLSTGWRGMVQCGSRSMQATRSGSQDVMLSVASGSLLAWEGMCSLGREAARAPLPAANVLSYYTVEKLVSECRQCWSACMRSAPRAHAQACHPLGLGVRISMPSCPCLLRLGHRGGSTACCCGAHDVGAGARRRCGWALATVSSRRDAGNSPCSPGVLQWDLMWCIVQR